MAQKKPVARSKAAAKPDTLTKASELAKVELHENDLDKVTGGASFSDITIPKSTDKSSTT